jgi:HlyD family secretion protein
MKKTLVITGIIIGAAFIFLFVFNRITTKSKIVDFYAEVQNGQFEIAVNATGELIPEKSIDIMGPEFAQGRDIRATMIKIQDLVPEGTIVKEGDFVATLDRTELTNNLKDAQDRLLQLQQQIEVKLLDTAVVMNGFRDLIKNQEFAVEEAEMTFRNSKYESPSVIRQAEINLDQARRILEQRRRSYIRQVAQNKTDIYNQNFFIKRITKRVTDLQEVLAEFTITSPGSGMIIYKKERRGNKRKIGSMINPMDRVVATLPDLTTMLSKTFVNEIDVSKIKPGQKVNVTIDAFPAKAFTGEVSFVANIGEQLPNTNDKVFEVQIKIDGSDPALRPSMTTTNKIAIKTVDEAVFIPTECVQAGIDSIPFVYKKNKTKQVVMLGESNEKHVIVEKGLEPGTMIYINNPEDSEKFRMAGEDLIPVLKEREKIKRIENEKYRKKPGA